MPAKPEALRTEWITDRAGLALVLGCSVNHVNKMVSQGMPRASRGTYVVPDCVQWRIHQLETTGALDPDEMPAVVAARTRLYEAQERRMSIDAARMAGELVAVEDHQEALFELSSVFTTALENLPGRMAGQIVQCTQEPEAYKLVQSVTDACREETSRRVQALARYRAEARADPGATAAA